MWGKKDFAHRQIFYKQDCGELDVNILRPNYLEED